METYICILALKPRFPVLPWLAAVAVVLHTLDLDKKLRPVASVKSILFTRRWCKYSWITSPPSTPSSICQRIYNVWRTIWRMCKHSHQYQCQNNDYVIIYVLYTIKYIFKHSQNKRYARIGCQWPSWQVAGSTYARSSAMSGRLNMAKQVLPYTSA